MLKEVQVTKRSLQEHFQKHYGFKVFSYERLNKGFANQLYKVNTDDGVYTFKVVIRNHPHRIKYEIELLKVLKNLPIPQPQKTRKDIYLPEFKKQKSLIYPFLPGEDKKEFTEHMLWQVGSFLGKLHLQTEGFSSSIERLEFYNLSADDVYEMVKKIEEKITDERILKTTSYIAGQIDKFFLPDGLPQGAIHADVKPENILFVEEELSGVVDFDNAYEGPLLFDLAHTMAWLCRFEGKTFDLSKARMLYLGYKEQRVLDAEEKNSLFEAVHYAFLSHVLVDIVLLAEDELPKKYIIGSIDTLLEAERKLTISKEEFNKKFF